MSTKTSEIHAAGDTSAATNSLESNETSSIKSSPLFGWLAAGSDLITAKLDSAAGMVSQRIDDTHEAIQSMQAKGLEVESELKRTLNPMAIVGTAQKIVLENPVISALSGSKKRREKDEQLNQLNAKVDLLVEQVALLAAKKAAAKVASKSASKNVAAEKKEANATSTKKNSSRAVASSKAKPTSTKTSSAKNASTTARRSKNATAEKTVSTTNTASKRPGRSSRKAAVKTPDTNQNPDSNKTGSESET